MALDGKIVEPSSHLAQKMLISEDLPWDHALSISATALTQAASRLRLDLEQNDTGQGVLGLLQCLDGCEAGCSSKRFYCCLCLWHVKLRSKHCNSVELWLRMPILGRIILIGDHVLAVIRV